MEVKKELPNVTISTEHYDIISSGSVVLQKGEYLDFLCRKARMTRRSL